MRTRLGLRSCFGWVALLVAWTVPAQAVTAVVANREPSLVGVPKAFDVLVTEAVGPAQIRWSFGDEIRTEFEIGVTQQLHTYAKPGHYAVLVTVKDDEGFTSVSFIHTVHEPLTPKRPSVSTDLIYDAARERVYNVNSDNDSVSVTDAVGLVKLSEIPVLGRPESLALAPGGQLWVLHSEAHAILTLDPETLTPGEEFALPYGSQPMGLVMSPAGDAAYVSLMALGKLLKLDPATGAVLGELSVGPWARGVSVSGDGRDVYVTRFISPDTHGEIVKVDGASFAVASRFELAPDTTTADSDQHGRGLANYLFSAAISPDGLRAWVPSKKDNMFRGLLRDGEALTPDSTVRPLVSVLDLIAGQEQLELRMDLDDRNLPSHVEFSPLGDYAFVSVTGSALIEVRDAYTGAFITALKEAGIAPRGLVLGPSRRLFAHGSLSRTLAVFDMNDILGLGDQTAKKLADIVTVGTEKLDAQVLQGKQLFFNSADARMNGEGYMSCASCHFDGFEDGRVWDFSSLGEGLRNSVSLLGRRGTGQGNVNWSGNLDEVQDAEHNIRNLFGGKGFLSDAAFAATTPLGEPKLGQSVELDAMAAYVESLTAVHPSPFRSPEGGLTLEAQAGRRLFKKLGCGFCHTGADATDSVRGKLHDVGTLKLSSGTRSAEPLLGIDTPTLLGIWETAPYLHDGSAATLADVLVTANPDDRHGYVSVLAATEVAELVAYLQQLDSTVDPEEVGPGGAGGAASTGGAGGTTPKADEPGEPAGCRFAPPRSRSASSASAALLALLALLARRGGPRSPRRLA